MTSYFITPHGLPPNPVLFPKMVDTFLANGVTIQDGIGGVDFLMVDLHTRLSDYRQSDVDYLLGGTTPIATFCEWDRGSMSDEVWPNPLTPQQKAIFEHIEKNNIKSVHFCRLLDKTQTYCYNLYPYEKGILHEEPPVSKDELFYRQYDVCLVANSSPNREMLKRILEADGRIKCNIVLGAPQIPFNNWIDEARKAKFFVTCSAGGFTDERMQALFSISAQIREDTDQLLLHDFTHGKNCIKISREPTKQDLDTIYDIANNKERLYDIYLNCIEFVQTYYTPNYIAKDILDKITKHLWEK